jgi:hypothetical protein
MVAAVQSKSGHVGAVVYTVALKEGAILQMLQLPLANPDSQQLLQTHLSPHISIIIIIIIILELVQWTQLRLAYQVNFVSPNLTNLYKKYPKHTYDNGLALKLCNCTSSVELRRI